MGFEKEYKRARDWVVNFRFSSINRPVNVFIVVTEVIGSLLSSYALTGDKTLLSRAHHIARALAPAYYTPSGLSYKRYNPYTGRPEGTELMLGEAGGQWLEYRFLANATGDREVGRRIDRIHALLQDIPKPQNLYFSSINSTSGRWTSDTVTLYSAASTFYSYLVKGFLQSGNTQSLNPFSKALYGIELQQLIYRSDHRLVYVRNFDGYSGEYGQYMKHDSCYLEAMFGLGAHSQQLLKMECIYKRLLDRAENIAYTCHLSCMMSRSGLPPTHIFFREIESVPNMAYNRFYLTSELAETYFVLWRLSKSKQKYREYAWQLAESLWRNARVREDAIGFWPIAGRILERP